MFQFLIFLVLCGVVFADDSQTSASSNRPVTPYGTPPVLPVAPVPPVLHPYQLSRTAPILRQDYNIYPEGRYDWAYLTGNGISAQEEGSLQFQRGPEPSLSVKGSYAYTSPEGIPISVSYIADENGFQPQGAHLPTPPPIPPAIQRALAWIAAHPQKK